MEGDSSLEKKISELDGRVSKLSEKVSENSKKIEILVRAFGIQKKAEGQEQDLVSSLHSEISEAMKPVQFDDVIEELKRGKVSRGQGKKGEFLLDILCRFPEEASGEPKRSFKRLVEVLWEGLCPKWKEDFSRLDCERALQDLRRHTKVLVCHEQDRPPHRYYTFNPRDEFYQIVQP